MYMPRMRTRVGKPDLAAEIPPEFPRPLLQDLHLLTREGHLNADARRKLKQIQHLIGLLRPALSDLLQRHAAPTVVDCGAGVPSRPVRASVLETSVPAATNTL